jgi:hypothetical protein
MTITLPNPGFDFPVTSSSALPPTKPTMDYSGFHVIAVISNPCEYQSRYHLYDIFAEDITRKGGQLWTLELQTGARPAVVTQAGKPYHIQLWTSALPGESWQKENTINVAIQHVIRQCPDARYIGWVDADLKFEDGAIEKTVQALQHWDVVQMWSHAVDFGPKGEIIGNIHQSFMYCYWNGIEVKNSNPYIHGGHPGFAWAARRDALNKMGTAIGSPLIQHGILGSGDRHMACGLIGRILESAHGDTHPNYRKWLVRWQEEADANIKRNVGYVENTVRHMWHGRKANRGYASRWKILVKHQFDPETDLACDVSGIIRLVVKNERQRALRDDIRRYFRAREEDATTTS